VPLTSCAIQQQGKFVASTIQARWVFAAIALACALALAAALYLQHVVGLEPCPLCIFQRIGVMAVGAISLLAAFMAPRGVASRAGGVLLALAALGGGVVSARHVWLQHMPADQVPACGPGLNYLVDTLPFSQVLVKVFKGSGECAVVDWTFLGISLPEMTGAFFLLVICVGLWLALRRR
jgi:disulfide bond formation protein DsbB